MSREGDVLVLKFNKDYEESPERQIEPDAGSFLSKSSNLCGVISENLSVFSAPTSENNASGQEGAERMEAGMPGNEDELTHLQIELWNLSQQEYYNEKKGLPKHCLTQIKKMKVGKVNKACSICHGDFIKDEKINKLPCAHIFHINA